MAAPIEEIGKNKRQSGGRKKIEIKKIEDTASRHVTFSKRQAGLFKKASELSVLCCAEAAIVVLSPKERVFTFGHPSADSVINRFLQFVQFEHDHEVGKCDSDDMKKCLDEITTLEDEKKRLEEIDGKKDLFWWKKDVEKMGLEELQEFVGALDELKKEVEMKVGDKEIYSMVVEDI